MVQTQIINLTDPRNKISIVMTLCFRKSVNEDEADKGDAGAASGGLRVSLSSLSFYHTSTIV